MSNPPHQSDLSRDLHRQPTCLVELVRHGCGFSFAAPFLNTLLFDPKFDVLSRSLILLQAQSISSHSCIHSDCYFAEDIQTHNTPPSPDKFESFGSHKKGNAVCPKCGRFGTFRKSQCYRKVTELWDPILFYFIFPGGLRLRDLPSTSTWSYVCYNKAVPVETITDIWVRHFHYILSASAIKMHKWACFILLVLGQLFILLTGSHFADEIGSEWQIINRLENILLTDARWDHHKASAHMKMKIPDGCVECDVTAASVYMRCFSNSDSIREKMKICLGWIIAAQLYTFFDQPNTHTHTLTHCLCFLCFCTVWGLFFIPIVWTPAFIWFDLRSYYFDYL